MHRKAATVGVPAPHYPSATEDPPDLQRRVKSFLESRSVPGLRRLTVEARGNVVVLRGTVRTYYEKQLAVHCCQHVAGVMAVTDQIEVQVDEPAATRP